MVSIGPARLPRPTTLLAMPDLRTLAPGDLISLGCLLLACLGLLLFFHEDDQVSMSGINAMLVFGLLALIANLKL